VSTTTSSGDVHNEAARSNAQAARQRNAVALEVAVTVSGTRPTDGESRGLFSEETSTVLVFEEGAVIRLAAEVAMGQLVFVTDKKTKREVVCQVVHKRASHATSSYVEVEFTEHMENFWGDVFAGVAKKGPLPKRSIGGGIGKPVQGERASVRMPMPEKTGTQAVKSEVAAKTVELLGMLEEKPAERALDAKNKREVKLPTTFMVENWKKAVEETAAKPVAMEDESTDELLPVPDLEFPQTESEVVAEVGGADEKPVKKGSGKIRVAILGGVLVAAGVGAAVAWYQNWLPFLPRTNGAKVVAVSPGNAHAKVAAKKADAVKSGGSAGVGTTAASGPAANVTKDAGTADVKDSRAGVESGGAIAAEKSEKETVGKASEGKRGEATASAATAASKDAAAEENEDAAEAIAPKLLKAVNPEYPVDAMRKYVTGDVRVEATVDAKGKVREAKAMFGPAALQEAAVEAVKQYEYAPATRGGKAVEGKVSVMVKFWFNP
jgi:TonB family protein